MKNMNNMKILSRITNITNSFNNATNKQPKVSNLSNLFSIQSLPDPITSIGNITNKTITHLKEQINRNKEKELQFFETMRKLLCNEQYNIFNIQESFSNFNELDEYIKSNDRKQLSLLLMIFVAYQSNIKPINRSPKLTNPNVTRMIVQYSKCKNVAHDLAKMLAKFDMLAMKYLFGDAQLPYISNAHIKMMDSALLFLQKLGFSARSQDFLYFIDEVAKLITANTKIPPKL